MTEKFELGPCAEGTAEFANRMRAIALLIFVIVFCLCWYLAVKWIYDRHLSNETDGTVLPYKTVRNFVLVIGCTLFIVSCLVAFG